MIVCNYNLPTKCAFCPNPALHMMHTKLFLLLLDFFWGGTASKDSKSAEEFI